MEDLCAQRVDVRRQPTLPAAALGHVHDLRQRGQRRVVMAGHDEGAAEDHRLRAITPARTSIPRSVAMASATPDWVGPRTAAHRVQDMRVAAGEQHQVPGPQATRRPTRHGDLALALDDDVHTA